MNERRISNHDNLQTHKGAPLENGVQVDLMGANGGRFERPPTRAELLRADIGKAATNTAIMREALLRQKEFYRDDLTEADMTKDNFEVIG